MSNASWRPLAEQMATGLALVDVELRVTWLNPALAERLALGTRTLVGQPAALMFADDAAVLAQARRALAEERALQLRGVALTTQRGTEWQADLSLQPFDGQLLLEVHALAEPAAAASPLSATLRGFAHEVKNPLAGLRGAAQLLQRRLDDADLKALAGMVIAEADRLGALANRLLHHDGAPRLGSVNIHRLLERLEDLLRPPGHQRLKQRVAQRAAGGRDRRRRRGADRAARHAVSAAGVRAAGRHRPRPGAVARDRPRARR